MTREEFEYAIKSCGCFILWGQTYYEESELIKAFEDLGLIHIGLEQEPKYCDHNICLRNEYNGIGCDECEVQEPREDAISRKDIQDYIAKYLSQYLYEDVRQAVEVIDAYIGDMPSVTQKSGKWDMSCTCSVCGQWRILESEKNGGKYKYCPNCGARMESEE